MSKRKQRITGVAVTYHRYLDPIMHERGGRFSCWCLVCDQLGSWWGSADLAYAEYDRSHRVSCDANSIAAGKYQREIMGTLLRGDTLYTRVLPADARYMGTWRTIVHDQNYIVQALRARGFILQSKPVPWRGDDYELWRVMGWPEQGY